MQQPPVTTPTRPVSDTPSRVSRLITLRAAILAAVCQVAVLFWVVRSEVTAKVWVSSWSISMPGIMLLLVFLMANARSRRRPFTPVELLSIYMVTSTTAAFAGYYFFQLLVVSMGAGRYWATPENEWARLWQYFPKWLWVEDAPGLAGLFQGQSPVAWSIWILPLAGWGLFVFGIYCLTLCINLLLADSWIRRERLTFPMASIPLEMTGGTLFQSRVFWLAFLLPVVIQSFIALSYYFPTVPFKGLKGRDLIEHVQDPPWAVLRPIRMGLTPFMIGLAYLSPLDVSFSVWFFQWLQKGERFFALTLGWVDASDLGQRGEPGLNQQCVGAFLTMGLLILWRLIPSRSERRLQRETGQAAVSLWTVGIALALFAGLVVFLRVAGFKLFVAVALLTVYLLFVLVMSRVRAEAGFAWTYAPDRGVVSVPQLMPRIFGTGALGERNLAMIGFFYWFFWDLRFSVMPSQMEALKIGDSARIQRKQLVMLLVAAMLVAIVVSFFAVLRDSYHYGWESGKVFAGPRNAARLGYQKSLLWIDNPTLPESSDFVWAGVGGAMTLFLSFMRQRFVWWPFHPIGYVMAATNTSYSFWGYYFIAWVLKALVLRYGGMKLYRQSLPLAYGLIIGDIATQCGWSLFGSILDLPVYQFI